MLKISSVSFEPVKRSLDIDPDVYVIIKRATLVDEGQRYQMLFGDKETALGTDTAAVEMWLTLDECNILNEDETPLLRAGMPFEGFMTGLTALWNYDPSIFWNIHSIVREVNPHWVPSDAGGNE